VKPILYGVMRSCTVQYAVCVCGGLEGLWDAAAAAGERRENVRAVDIIENQASFQSRIS